MLGFRPNEDAPEVPAEMIRQEKENTSQMGISHVHATFGDVVEESLSTINLTVGALIVFQLLLITGDDRQSLDAFIKKAVPQSNPNLLLSDGGWLGRRVRPFCVHGGDVVGDMLDRGENELSKKCGLVGVIRTVVPPDMKKLAATFEKPKDSE